MLSDSPKPAAGDSRASWWQAIFDSSEDALLVCDRTGALIESNRRAAKFFPPSSVQTTSRILEALSEHTCARLIAVIERDSSQPELLSSITFAPSPAHRAIVDLTLTRLEPNRWLIALKDASR